MNLEPTLWPRAAALAEVFWSGPGPDGRPRSQFLQIMFPPSYSLINIADFFFLITQAQTRHYPECTISAIEW